VSLRNKWIGATLVWCASSAVCAYSVYASFALGRAAWVGVLWTILLAVQLAATVNCVFQTKKAWNS